MQVIIDQMKAMSDAMTINIETRSFWSERRCADGEVAIKLGIIFSLLSPAFY